MFKLYWIVWNKATDGAVSPATSQVLIWFLWTIWICCTAFVLVMCSLWTKHLFGFGQNFTREHENFHLSRFIWRLTKVSFPYETHGKSQCLGARSLLKQSYKCFFLNCLLKMYIKLHVILCYSQILREKYCSDIFYPFTSKIKRKSKFDIKVL